MSIRHLDALFDPHSVAVVGATDKPGSVGAIACARSTNASARSQDCARIARASATSGRGSRPPNAGWFSRSSLASSGLPLRIAASAKASTTRGSCGARASTSRKRASASAH